MDGELKKKEVVESSYKTLMTKIGKLNFWHFAATISTIYILNPTAGFFELIPDILPLVGNIDETFFNGLLFLSLFELDILDEKKIGKIKEIKTIPFRLLKGNKKKTID